MFFGIFVMFLLLLFLFFVQIVWTFLIAALNLFRKFRVAAVFRIINFTISHTHTDSRRAYPNARTCSGEMQFSVNEMLIALVQAGDKINGMIILTYSTFTFSVIDNIAVTAGQNSRNTNFSCGNTKTKIIDFQRNNHETEVFAMNTPAEFDTFSMKLNFSVSLARSKLVFPLPPPNKMEKINFAMIFTFNEFKLCNQFIKNSLNDALIFLFDYKYTQNPQLIAGKRFSSQIDNYYFVRA